MMTEPLRLYGFVGDSFGDGFTAKSVAAELDARKGAKALDVYLSSGGGSVDEGLAIYAQMARFPGNVTVHVDGVAASIASIIALAGDRLVMPPSAMMMIHRPWAGAMVAGNSTELREQAKRIQKMADGLDAMNETMRGLYCAACNQPPATVQKMMDDETWLTAEKAKALGFADEVSGESAQASSSRPDLLFVNLYQNTPSALRTMRAEAALAKLESLLMRQRVEATARSASAAAAGFSPGIKRT